MREIKFRAWDKKEMHYGVGIDSTDTYPRCITGASIDSLRMLPLENIELMQYIGLKDKHGKEIYEGDIFRIPPDKHHKEPEDNIVEYFEGIYMLADHGLHLNDWNEKGEIIGNIYENPELAP